MKRHWVILKKVSSTLQLPNPSIFEGLGLPFCLFLRHNNLMNILQSIFNDYYEQMLYFYIPAHLLSKMLTRCFIAVTLLSAVPCIPALLVVTSSSSLSAVNQCRRVRDFHPLERAHGAQTKRRKAHPLVCPPPFRLLI